MKRFAIVLAAGKGSSMNSRNPEISKVSYEILGKPMINYVIDTIKLLNPVKIVTVVGHGGEKTSELVRDDSDVVWQKDICGTGDAVRQCKELLHDEDGVTLVMYGDTPLVEASTLEKVFSRHEKDKNDITIVSAVLEYPEGYGRIIRQTKSNKLVKVIEEKDCDEWQLGINEVNTGICLINNKILWKYIDKIDNHNARKLFNLSQLVELFLLDNLKADVFVASEMKEMFGINNRVQLAYASRVVQKRVNEKLMLSGVSIEDPTSTYISPDISIGKDTIIYPNTFIFGKTSIGEGNVIGPNVSIFNSLIGNENLLSNCYLKDCKITNQQKITDYITLEKENR